MLVSGALSPKPGGGRAMLERELIRRARRTWMPQAAGLDMLFLTTCNATGGEGEARLATLRRSLKAFDVVGTLERFDETLLLVADAVGLQRLLHPPVQPRPPWAPAPGRDADAAQRADGRAQAMGCW